MRYSRHFSLTKCFVDILSIQICRALAYIHNCIGICHRDIKPQNLLVSSCVFLSFGPAECLICCTVLSLSLYIRPIWETTLGSNMNGHVTCEFSPARWTHTPTSWNYVILEVLKCWFVFDLTFYLDSCDKFCLWEVNFGLLILFIRSKGNLMFHTFAQDTIVLQNSSLVLLSIQLL